MEEQLGEGEEWPAVGKAGGGQERGGVGGGMASCPTCNFCQKRTHTDALCVLNPGSQNFKKDLVCQTCGVRGHSSKVCNEAIRAAVKNTGNKPFPNYSVEIAEMLGEEVEDMRIRLPLVVNDLCTEVMYDMGATHSHCDEAWARKYGVRWESRREYAVTQSGLEVLVKGEAWVKFKYGQLTYKQKWLVIQGSQEFAVVNERDGVKLGIYVTGIAPVHAGANLSVVDDREWLEEGEFSGGTEELLESKKLEVVEGIIGEANAELPDRSVCRDASLVHSFDVPKGTVIY